MGGDLFVHAESISLWILSLCLVETRMATGSILSLAIAIAIECAKHMSVDSSNNNGAVE